jgi:hypothetical protein
VIVPAVAARAEVVEERHILLRHAGVQKLLASLMGEYWWPAMADDVARIVRECDACQKARPRFTGKLPMQPTYKGVQPFQVWSVDSIPNLAGMRGMVVVAVDCFSKWVEIGVVRSH